MDNTNVVGARMRRNDHLRVFAEETKELSLRQCPISVAFSLSASFSRGHSLSHAEIMEILNNTIQAQEKLWPTLEKALMQGKLGAIEVSMVTAMIDVLNMHRIRLAALFDKLPKAVIWMLIFISAATIAVTGFNAGLSGKISRWRTATLALVMVGVMLMILDYDRPRDGFIRVSQYSLNTVIAEMEANLDK